MPKLHKIPVSQFTSRHNLFAAMISAFLVLCSVNPVAEPQGGSGGGALLPLLFGRRVDSMQIQRRDPWLVLWLETLSFVESGI